MGSPLGRPMALVTENLATLHDRDLLRECIAQIETDCPRRGSTSADELRAQQLLEERFLEFGLRIAWQSFPFSTCLYAVMALHFAVAVAGSVCYLWLPWLGAALHLLAAVSYVLDCHYRGFWLRRWLPWRTSQNLVATSPARGAVRRRLVLIGHADAAPTGWMFQPGFLRSTHVRWPAWLALARKHMLAAVLSWCVLAGLDVTIALSGYWFPWMYFGLTVGSIVPLVLMLQISLTRRIVRGANDNLTGCAATLLLAKRLMQDQPDDVELVFVITGCEESGRGGAAHLAQSMRRQWNTQNTTVIGLDTLSGGELRYHVEGELVPLPPPQWLRETLESVSHDGREAPAIRPYHAPAGATDAAPFAWRGYPAVCITRIDPASDLPQNYHVPADNIENLDIDEVYDATRYAEELVRRLWRQ